VPSNEAVGADRRATSSSRPGLSGRRPLNRRRQPDLTMPSHTAESLFKQNIQSAEDCRALYDGMKTLQTQLQIHWILRAGVVFVVSALDTYFHDKIKYRVGKYSLANLPPALAKFEIPISDLTKWESAERKGNVLRNWITESLSVKPLQRREAIADAMKLAGINDVWSTIEPDKEQRQKLFDEFDALVRRRNQIAHEGDRQHSRRSGKRLHPIDRKLLDDAITFATNLVAKVEVAFPG
jgi:hypothetical protein